MFTSRYEKFPELATGLYFGPAQDTYYSRRSECRLPYASVKHLLESGRLFQVFGDFEASDKDRESAAPKDGAFLTFDLMGRVVSKLFVPVAIPPYVTYAVGASLVGNVWPENYDKGYPPFMAAAMIREYYASASRVNPAALGLRATAFNDREEGFIYPLDFPDVGRIDLEINHDGKKFRLPGEEAWRKIYGVWRPFNGENYDDFLASHWFAGLGSAHLFVSSRKAHNFQRIDERKTSMWLWAFGPQGEQSGFVLPPRFHNKTRRSVVSTRLGDIVGFHTPEANRKRGLDDGTYYYDGRTFDPDHMHGSPEDTAATASAWHYKMRRFPDEMRIIEQMSDEQVQKNFLQGNAAFGDRPLVGFFNYDHGMLTRHIGMLLTTGDRYGQKSRNEVILINLSDFDPRELRDKTDSELRALIAGRKLLTHHRTNQTPIFADFDRAFLAGAGGGLSPDELQARRMSLINAQDEMNRLADLAYDMRSGARPLNVQTPRRLEADSFSHYGDLEYIPLRDPVSGKELADEPMDIYMRRKGKWEAERQIDEHLNLQTQGQGTDFSDDRSALLARQALWNKSERFFATKTGHWRFPVSLPATGFGYTSPLSARKKDWTLRWEARDMRFSNTPDCWLMNERGQLLPWEKVLAMPYQTRKNLWPAPNQGEDFTEAPHLRVSFRRDTERYPILTTLIAYDADRFYRKYEDKEFLAWWKPFFAKTWGRPEIRKWYEAYIALNVQGPPNLPPLSHPTMTEARKLAEITELKDKAPGSPASEYATRVLSQPQGQRLLAVNEADCRRRLETYRWTPEKLVLAGYDSQTATPLPNPDYWVGRTQNVTLKVPDILLDSVRWQDQWHSHLVLPRPSREALQRLSRLEEKGRSLLLVGQETNRVRLVIAPTAAALPDSADGRAALQAAESAYATIGQKIGPHPFLLTFQQIAPIHGERPIDPTMQSVAIPASDWNALVNKRAGSMGGFEGPLTTLIVRDLDLNASKEYAPGPIRLRRKSGGVESGDEYTGTVIAANRITVGDLARLSDAEAQKAGHSTTANLVSAWRRLFADMNAFAPEQQKLWRLDIAPVDKATATYYRPEELPVACYIPARPATQTAPLSPSTPEAL